MCVRACVCKEAARCGYWMKPEKLQNWLRELGSDDNVDMYL